MKRGDTFIHKHWLDELNNPLECFVTRVARGTVYWRPVGGGSPMCFGVDQISKYVAGVCDQAFYDYVKQQIPSDNTTAK
jgi:hypothetical protein